MLPTCGSIMANVAEAFLTLITRGVTLTYRIDWSRRAFSCHTQAVIILMGLDCRIFKTSLITRCHMAGRARSQ